MVDCKRRPNPLKTTPHDEAVLDVRLDAARNLYNACLWVALRRLDLMRKSGISGGTSSAERQRADRSVQGCPGSIPVLRVQPAQLRGADQKRLLDRRSPGRSCLPENCNPQLQCCRAIRLTAGAGRGSKDMAGSPASKVKATLPAFAGGMAMSCGASWIWCRGST